MLRLARCPSGWSVGCYAMRSDTKPATCAAMLRGRLKLACFDLPCGNCTKWVFVAAECMCGLAVHTVYLCGVALGVRSMKALAIQGLVNPCVCVVCICAKPQVAYVCCVSVWIYLLTYQHIIPSSRSSNLVDSASSHTLVSKIKPCMSKYKFFYFETANGSLYQL